MENEFVLVGGTDEEREKAKKMLVDNGVNANFITAEDKASKSEFLDGLLTKTGFDAESLEKAQAKRLRKNKKRLEYVI